MTTNIDTEAATTPTATTGSDSEARAALHFEPGGSTETHARCSAAVVLRPLLFDDNRANDTALIAGAAWDVAALATATALAVFKPGRAAWKRR